MSADNAGPDALLRVSLTLRHGVFRLEGARAAGAIPAPVDLCSMHAIANILQHEPATADELETAIAVIEDSIMPALRKVSPGVALMTSEPVMRDIATAAGLVVGRGDLQSVSLSIASVEKLFNRLADVANGMPVARAGMPVNREFAATLLLLRELMHHGRFGAILVVP